MGGPTSPAWGQGWKMVVPGRSVLMTRGRALSRAAAIATRRGSPGVKNWDGEGEGSPGGRRLGRTEKAGGGLCAKITERRGGCREERKGHRVRWGLGRQRPADRRKEGGWEGGESSGRPAALGGHRRHRAGGPERAARRPRGHGDATRDSPWLGVRRRPVLRRVGRRGPSATASLPALGLAGSGCRTARTAAAAPSARSLAHSLGRPGRGAPSGRAETAACTAPPSPGPQPRRPLRRKPRLRSPRSPLPARPAPHPLRTAQLRTSRVSRVFSLCGIRSALALDAAEISRLGPRLSSGQKPSSISKTHDASPCGPWPGLARSWGPDRPTRSGSPQVELRAEKVGDPPALGVCPPFFPFHLLGSRESRQLQWASVCCLGTAGDEGGIMEK